MSELNKGENHPNYGKHLSEDHKRKLSDAHKGKHLSEFTKQKISEANKGKKLSKEARQKMSDSRKGKKNHFYGKHHTEKARKKMSETHKNTSKETRVKMSRSHQGRAIFGLSGVVYKAKNIKPWRKVWNVQITYYKKRKSLGMFEDPISAQIVYNFVWNEIYNTYDKE